MRADGRAGSALTFQTPRHAPPRPATPRPASSGGVQPAERAGVPFSWLAPVTTLGHKGHNHPLLLASALEDGLRGRRYRNIIGQVSVPVRSMHASQLASCALPSAAYFKLDKARADEIAHVDRKAAYFS